MLWGEKRSEQRTFPNVLRTNQNRDFFEPATWLQGTLERPDTEIPRGPSGQLAILSPKKPLKERCKPGNAIPGVGLFSFLPTHVKKASSSRLWLNEARMAERMATNRSQLDRLLDPENEGVTLHTLKRAAAAVGMRLELELRQA